MKKTAVCATLGDLLYVFQVESLKSLSCHISQLKFYLVDLVCFLYSDCFLRLV